MFNHHDQATGLRKLMQTNQPRILGLLTMPDENPSRVMINLAQAFASIEVDVAIVDTAVETGQQPTLPSHHQAALQPPLFSRVMAEAQSHEVVLMHTNIARLQTMHASQAKLSHPAMATSQSLFACTELIVQVTAQPASITAAYRMIKDICTQFGRLTFSVLVHETSEKIAQRIFANLAKTAKQFMQVDLRFIGCIPTDASLNKAMQLGRSVIDAFPMAAASLAFKALAKQIHAPAHAWLGSHPQAMH